jgi:hypothetical protein
LDIPPRRTLPPVEFCRGTRPSQAANSRPLRKPLGSVTVAAIRERDDGRGQDELGDEHDGIEMGGKQVDGEVDQGALSTLLARNRLSSVALRLERLSPEIVAVQLQQVATSLQLAGKIDLLAARRGEPIR